MPTRILAVDDDRSIGRFIEKTLAKSGFEVDTAIDGQRAKELVDQNEYALAVLDFHMPDVDGASLFVELLEMQDDLVAVFLTGDPTLNTVFPAIDAGAYRVLAKPISADELVKTVQEALNGQPGPA